MAKQSSSYPSQGSADFDQYTSVKWLIQAGDRANWVPETEQTRLAAYTKYEEIYWTDEKAFKLMRRGSQIEPIIVPQARTIADSTAHYLLKGLRLEAQGDAQPVLDAFLKREKFNSRLHIAKHSGVVRGDWLMHITADPDEEDGKRVSLTSLDPASYFPICDDDDLDKIIKVYLVEMFKDGDGQDAVKRKVYAKEKIDGKTRISVEEAIFEADPDKWYGTDEPPLKRSLIKPMLLPESIQAIPVYHFKNMDWQGQPYGSSELRGFERIMASINQTLSDEELALALEGLGVYATDGGSPVDGQGNRIPWEIAPAKVMEVANGAYFRRVEGITSVTPMLDHVKYLEEQAMEASGTFRAGQVDVQVAESGIALAIRFLPTLAKIEERDLAGVDTCAQLFHDWTYWEDEYESTKVKPGQDIEPVLGEKLPINRQELVSELNNMLDRNVISRAYYRDQMKKLFGIQFSDNIEQEILDELEALAQFKTTPPGLNAEEELSSGDPDNPDAPTTQNGNRSNNKNKPNESGGTEAGHTSARQSGNQANRNKAKAAGSTQK